MSILIIYRDLSQEKNKDKYVYIIEIDYFRREGGR